jgi:hypothetical protein
MFRDAAGFRALAEPLAGVDGDAGRQHEGWRRVLFVRRPGDAGAAGQAASMRRAGRGGCRRPARPVGRSRPERRYFSIQ